MARELSGSSLADLARGAVTPLLVPDLPVMVLFFTAPDEDVLSRLAKLVDRVVLDSRRQPLAGLARVARIAAGGGAADLEDLAWRETGRWRRLLCDFFDEASARPLLSEVKEVEVEHGGSVTTAALLAGWLASRLGWEMERSQSRSREVRAALRRGGGNVEVVLRETTVAGAAGAGIAGVSLRSGEGHEAPFVRLRLGEGAGLVRLEYSTREACVLPRSQPFRREDDAVLLGLALERPTPPQVFREALAMAARMV
jgi:glucose-6-phosphate dehydrogenase assembly protein OpcA